MNFDMTFCVADCTNADCERNLNFVELPAGLLRPISQADFSDTCNMYEGALIDDYDPETELDFND